MWFRVHMGLHFRVYIHQVQVVEDGLAPRPHMRICVPRGIWKGPDHASGKRGVAFSFILPWQNDKKGTCGTHVMASCMRPRSDCIT